jgi:multidrug resistance protein
MSPHHSREASMSQETLAMNNLNHLGKNDSRLAIDRKALPDRSPSRQSWCTCDDGDDHHHAFRQDKLRLAEMDLEAQQQQQQQQQPLKTEGGMGPGPGPGGPGGPKGPKGPKDPNIVCLDRSSASPASTNASQVTFDGPNDPYNPKNWTSRKRWAATYVMSAFVFVSPLASSMVAPCLVPISKDFHMDPLSIETQIVLSVFVLAYAVGPMIFGPLSELYGRVLVLQVTNAVFLAFNLACGFATNKTELIAFRFLAGLGGSAPLAIGGAVLGDLFKPEERGKAMGLYAMGPLLGPAIGPIIGGFVAQYSTWRWLFWATSMADAVILTVGLFYLRESYAPLLLWRKCKLLRKQTGNPNLKTEFPDMDQPAAKKLRTTIVRSFSLLFTQPIVQVLSIYMAFAYGCLYLVLSTFPRLWEYRYGEAPGIAGLNYISIGLGFFIGAPLIGKTNDKVYHKLKAKDPRGQGKPEFRMPLMIPFSFLVPIGIFIYGWSAQARWHWIVPNIGAFIFGMGTIAAFQCVTTYLVDSYTRFAASAIAAVTVLRSLAGFGFPLFAPYMYDALGYGWGNSVVGFAAICIGFPAPVLLWLFGEKLRKRSKFAVGSKQ